MQSMYLPALRGYFGDWTYYACLMKLKDIAERVSYPRELHSNTGLSDMIQRRLREGRGKEISAYLSGNPSRFFNSLVIAVYEGAPSWLEFDEVIAATKDDLLKDLDEETKHTVGYLYLIGSERLFTLDGQHRLAGIKLALEDNDTLGDEELSVIFVAHNNSVEGLRRTRRLFTTLNKTAKPVSKADVIALDESDGSLSSPAASLKMAACSLTGELLSKTGAI